MPHGVNLEVAFAFLPLKFGNIVGTYKWSFYEHRLSGGNTHMFWGHLSPNYCHQFHLKEWKWWI